MERPSGLWYWWGIMVALNDVQKIIHAALPQLTPFKVSDLRQDPLHGARMSDDTLWLQAVLDDEDLNLARVGGIEAVVRDCARKAGVADFVIVEFSTPDSRKELAEFERESVVQ